MHEIKNDLLMTYFIVNFNLFCLENLLRYCTFRLYDWPDDHWLRYNQTSKWK